MYNNLRNLPMLHTRHFQKCNVFKGENREREYKLGYRRNRYNLLGIKKFAENLTPGLTVWRPKKQRCKSIFATCPAFLN